MLPTERIIATPGDDATHLALVQHHPLHKRANDLCAVEVAGGNLEKAIRLLRKQVGASYHLRIARTRELFPSRGDRRRAKRAAAEARRKKDAKRK